MATTTLNYSVSTKSFAGGLSVGAGKGDTWKISLTEAGTESDELQLDVVTNSQVLVQASGDVIGTSPIACLTLANRVYFVSSNRLSFSALADATTFEQQGVGSGYIDTANNYQQAEGLTGLASYQGRLATLSRYTVQIWSISPDPSAFQLVQTLPNTGTFAPLSVQSIGDLDVLYLSDLGVRSLRVRDSSLNAFVVDTGSPVDITLQNALLTLTDSQKAQACAIVEPSTGRYWLHLAGTIYVLSYFPSLKIVAWSTYKPTWDNSGTATTFYPQKFEVYQGRVYATDGVAIYLYGGTNNATYDASIATIALPYLDCKMPETRKLFSAIDVDITGNWYVYADSNPLNPSMTKIIDSSSPTYEKGEQSMSMDGYHCQVKFVSTGSAAAKVSAMALTYKPQDSK